MGQRTLFILAAYPAAGKSTLLGQALAGRIALFGPEFEPELRLALRAKQPDEFQSTQAKLASGMWMTLADLAWLERSGQVPANMVLHLDLLLLALLGVRPKAISDLDRESIAASTDTFFRRPLFALFDRLVVNTLRPAFDFVLEQWQRRTRDDDLSDEIILLMKNDIIVSSRNREQIHAMIHDDWLAAVARRTPHAMVMTHRAPDAADDGG